jgi:hypothetical protein
MICVAPVRIWRLPVHGYSNEEIAGKLEWACLSVKSIKLKPDERVYHDWIQLRALLIRETRKRGLDLSVAGY